MSKLTTLRFIDQKKDSSHSVPFRDPYENQRIPFTLNEGLFSSIALGVRSAINRMSDDFDDSPEEDRRNFLKIVAASAAFGVSGCNNAGDSSDFSVSRDNPLSLGFPDSASYKKTHSVNESPDSDERGVESLSDPTIENLLNYLSFIKNDENSLYNLPGDLESGYARPDYLKEALLKIKKEWDWFPKSVREEIVTLPDFTFTLLFDGTPGAYSGETDRFYPYSVRYNINNGGKNGTMVHEIFHFLDYLDKKVVNGEHRINADNDAWLNALNIAPLHYCLNAMNISDHGMNPYDYCNIKIEENIPNTLYIVSYLDFASIYGLISPDEDQATIAEMLYMDYDSEILSAYSSYIYDENPLKLKKIIMIKIFLEKATKGAMGDSFWKTNVDDPRVFDLYLTAKQEIFEKERGFLSNDYEQK